MKFQYGYGIGSVWHPSEVAKRARENGGGQLRGLPRNYMGWTPSMDLGDDSSTSTVATANPPNSSIASITGAEVAATPTGFWHNWGTGVAAGMTIWALTKLLEK